MFYTVALTFSSLFSFKYLKSKLNNHIKIATSLLKHSMDQTSKNQYFYAESDNTNLSTHGLLKEYYNNNYQQSSLNQYTMLYNQDIKQTIDAHNNETPNIYMKIIKEIPSIIQSESTNTLSTILEYGGSAIGVMGLYSLFNTMSYYITRSDDYQNHSLNFIYSTDYMDSTDYTYNYNISHHRNITNTNTMHTKNITNSSRADYRELKIAMGEDKAIMLKDLQILEGSQEIEHEEQDIYNINNNGNNVEDVETIEDIETININNDKNENDKDDYENINSYNNSKANTNNSYSHNTQHPQINWEDTKIIYNDLAFE